MKQPAGVGAIANPVGATNWGRREESNWGTGREKREQTKKNLFDFIATHFFVIC